LRPGKCTLTSFKGKHGFYKIRKSAHFLQFRLWNLETPSNGILSQSPGLRGTRYPGSSSQKHHQPQRGCGHSRPSIARDLRRNRVAVVSISEPEPKVAPNHRGNLGLEGAIPLGLPKCGCRVALTRRAAAGIPARFFSQSSLRAGCPAVAAAPARGPRIPTGFRPKAQGCAGPGRTGDQRYPGSSSNQYFQPQRGCGHFRTYTQGRRCTPTLGWWAQSLWDWQTMPSLGITMAHMPQSLSAVYIHLVFHERPSPVPARQNHA